MSGGRELSCPPGGHRLDGRGAGLERGLWRASTRAIGTGRGRRVARQALEGLRDQETCDNC